MPKDSSLQPHIMCKSGDIARYVILPGDPGRVSRIAQLLDSPKEIAFNREFRTVTGKYQGINVSVCSTGIGGPSTAIAIKELCNLGAEVLIRIGSCGSNQEYVEVGDLVVSEGAVREDHTALDFVPLPYPAVADRFVLHALEMAAHGRYTQTKQNFRTGVTLSADGLYSAKNLERKDFWRPYGVLAQEMEIGTLYPLARMYGVRAGALLLVVNKIGVKDLSEGIRKYAEQAQKGEGLMKKENQAAQTVLEAIRILHDDYGI